MNAALLSALNDTLAAASALTTGLEAVVGVIVAESTKAVPLAPGAAWQDAAVASAPAAQAQALLHHEFAFEQAQADPNRDAKGRLVKGHKLNEGRKKAAAPVITPVVTPVQETLDIQAVVVQAPVATAPANEVEVIRTHRGGVTLATVAALKAIGCPDEVVTASTRKDAYPRVESWCISNAIDMVVGAAI